MTTSPRTSNVAGKLGGFELLRRDGERDGANRPHVVGHILADAAVAAGYSASQMRSSTRARRIVQRQRKTIELKFRGVANLRAVALGQFAHTPVPITQLFFAVHVVERQHGPGVGDLGETFLRLAPNTLRGRVGGDQLGMLRFQLLQLTRESIECSIGNFGRILPIVKVLVVADLFAQLFDSVGGLHSNGL